MSIRLEKGHRISLDKEAGKPVRRIEMGLGWSAAGTKGGGFFRRLLDRFGRNIDLDASCLLLDADGNTVNAVWFANLRTDDGSVRHSGDNLTGKRGGDVRVPDEVISVDLDRLPGRVTQLVFTVCSFQGQTFSAVANAFCSLKDTETGSELCFYDVSGEGNDATALIMCRMYRKNSEWKIAAVGEYCHGRTVGDLEEPVRRIARTAAGD